MIPQQQGQYVPAVDRSREYYHGKITIPQKFNFDPYRTTDVISCAQSLLVAFKNRAAAVRSGEVTFFDLANVLADHRNILSDALREAGCNNEDIHWHIGRISVTVAERILGIDSRGMENYTVDQISSTEWVMRQIAIEREERAEKKEKDKKYRAKRKAKRAEQKKSQI